MLCKSITVLAAAGLASAATPSGFQPGSTTELIVSYNGVQAQSGSVVARDGEHDLLQQPTPVEKDQH